jgi:hypothetical protein
MVFLIKGDLNPGLEASAECPAGSGAFLLLVSAYA